MQEAPISSSDGRRRAGNVNPVGLLGGLTPRDLYLFDVLEAHRVLTAGQVTALLFPSLDRAQRRLLALTQRGVLTRFRGYVRPGSQPWRYTLGYPGVELLAAAHARRPPSRTAHDLSLTRLARSRQLDHLLGVNGFFTDLAGHAATQPGAQLMTWYSESTTYAVLSERLQIHLRPDGYGRWHDTSGDVGFLLEHDTGSEPLHRLLDKLNGYDEHHHLGLTVLLHLPSAARETNLHRQAPLARRLPVATTAADLTTGGHSLAGPVWLPLGDRRRRSLAELAHPGGRTLWDEYRNGTAPPPAPHLPVVG